MLKQLFLPIQPLDMNSFQNFYPGANTLLLNFLQSFSLRKGEAYIYIWGSLGAGCTHLLQASCHLAQEQGFSVAYLPLKLLKKTSSPEVFLGLETMDIVCIDDLDSVAKDPVWQEALFHFYNRLHEQKSSLLIAAHNSPHRLGLSLRDLVSRLSNGVLFQVFPLKDEERLAALKQRARFRGLLLSEDVGRFLLSRLPRHSKAIFSAFEQLDKATLSLKRKLTIPLVKSILHI